MGSKGNFINQITLFRVIYNRMKTRKKIKSFIYDNNDYLPQGIYNISTFEGKPVAYLKDDKVKRFIHKNQNFKELNKKDKVKRIANNIINHFLRIRTNFDNNHSTTSILIMLTYNQDIKVFDFENKQVLTYMEKIDYDNLKYNYNLFKKNFLIPQMKFSDDKNLSIEKLINFKPTNSWSTHEKNEAVKTVFNNYTSLAEHYTGEKCNVLKLIKQFENGFPYNHRLNKIIKTQAITSWDIPLIMSHNDIHFRNILLSEKKLHFIDWEYCTENVFFYDVINLFFVEALFGDYSYLDKFLSGYYDEFFEKLCDAYGDSYLLERKEQYIIVYIIVRIIIFDLKNSDDQLIIMANQYEKVLNYIMKNG